MDPSTSEEDRFPREGQKNFKNDKSMRVKRPYSHDQGSASWRKPFPGGFKNQRNEKPNFRRTDQGLPGNDRFKNDQPYPAHKKKGKVKKSEKTKTVEKLKNNAEYSHLVNSTKLTVFDWDCTVVLRNLPAQVDAVKSIVKREMKDIAIKKFCPIKKTFKNNAVVTLACVLNNKEDVDRAVAELTNLKVGNYHIIASRFVKPHSFMSNAFSACIFNFSDNASEKVLSEILKDCGVVSALEVQYSESGAVKKVLVNLTNTSDLDTLLLKDGTQFETAAIKIIALKPCTSIIVGNVHHKVSHDKLGKLFGEGVLLVQKINKMMFQIFFKDEESAEKALSKDGESLKDLIISVRPWSKKNSKQYKVCVYLTGNEDQGKGTFDINKFLQGCGKLTGTVFNKKSATFLVTFESKEGQKAALQLNGNVVKGLTVEVTKKSPVAKKFKPTSTDQNTASKASSNPPTKKNHVYFD